MSVCFFVKKAINFFAGGQKIVCVSARKTSTSVLHFPDIVFYRIFKNQFRNHQKHGILQV